MFKAQLDSISKNISNLKVGDSVLARLGRGSLWTLIGFGGNIILRMLSSLILTRIFLPDIFGLMAIITSILIGVQLLSDVGIRNSIIQNPRGEEPTFLRTAWTIQVIRGFVLWLIIYLISKPLADLYNEPDLVRILPFVGITTIISAFASTSMHVITRKLIVGKLIRFELFIQLIGLITTVILALQWRDIWAIIVGNVITTTIATIGSYVYFRGGVVGFQLERPACLDIIHFGKWIFIATTLTFLVGQGDRLLLGTILSKTELGLYNLAVLFSQLSMVVLSALSAKTLVPALSEVNNKDQGQLNNIFHVIQKYLILFILPIILITAIFGNHIIMFFYETPYHSAGWILQILSVGMVIQLLCYSIAPILLSKGDSFSHMISIGSWSFFYITAMIVGYKMSGLVGLIIGISIAPLAWLPIVSYQAGKYIKVNHKLSIIVIISSSIIIGFGWWLVGVNIVI